MKISFTIDLTGKHPLTDSLERGTCPSTRVETSYFMKLSL